MPTQTGAKRNKESREDKNEMSILSNSWAQHLRDLASNDEGNKNMEAFTRALEPHKTYDQKINALTKEINAVVLIVGPYNTIVQSHSWTKFGGTRSQQNTTISCLIGTGAQAIAVTIDHNHAIKGAQTKLPTRNSIDKCKTIDELKDFAAATLRATEPPSTTPNKNEDATANETTITNNDGDNRPDNNTGRQPGQKTRRSTT